MSVKFEIRDYTGLMRKLDDMKKAPRKVLEATTADAKKRVPPWIAAEVAKEYGVKKAEVNSGKLGKMKVKGERIDGLTFEYTGRVLTPTHFGMTPKAPGKNAYTLKAQIIRGQKATLGKVKKLTKKQRRELGKNFRREGARNSSHSPVMLMPTGSTYIPFQRKSPRRSDVEAIKTLSLPQMVSGRASEGITKAINEGLEKRLEHHMNRYMGK